MGCTNGGKWPKIEFLGVKRQEMAEQWGGNSLELRSLCIYYSAGVRQGGVLSPDLYSIYVDELIHILQSSGIGCHISSTFAAALLYADDMCILAPSMKGLQRLLIICGQYCERWDIGLNAKKTKNMFFGKK